ncbi:hypothetical protein N483_06055 [Pseudoalteromonas luteoviolacea NCIMB 1944]|nr:hypothetical protein N483_06055 [Pseudoalteromonas luteoviolacea NCIMB 1944]
MCGYAKPTAKNVAQCVSNSTLNNQAKYPIHKLKKVENVKIQHSKN